MLDTENIIKYIPKTNIDKINFHSSTLFGNWFSMKLYFNADDYDDFIRKILVKMNQELYESNIINDMFFIRYRDEKDHLRVRFHLSINVDYNKLFFVLKKYLSNKRLIEKIEVDTYVREVERYGGEQVINYFEKYFCVDSYEVINYLIIEKRNEKIFRQKFYLMSCLNMIKNMKVSKKVLIALDKFGYNKSLRKEIEKHYSDFYKILTNDYVYDSQQLAQIFANSNKVQSMYWKEIEEIHKENIYNQQNIFLSLLHMKFNRLLGINREFEIETMQLLRKILKNYEGKSKYQNL